MTEADVQRECGEGCASRKYYATGTYGKLYKCDDIYGNYSGGSANKTSTVNSCETGEKCMDVNGEYSPAGYDCTLRGVCPGTQACCKKDADPSATPAIKTGAAANSGTAANSAGTSGGTAFTNPLQFKTVDALLSNVLLSVQMIIGTLALVFIVIGAVMILSSAGTPEMVERGKKAITMAFIGLAIGVAAPSLLKELAKAIGWGGTAQTAAALSLSQIALNVLNFLLGIAGVLTLIMLVIGGIMYLTSAGDEERIDSGKKIFRNSLIGIVIILVSMVLVQQIAKFFVAG